MAYITEEQLAASEGDGLIGHSRQEPFKQIGTVRQALSSRPISVWDFAEILSRPSEDPGEWDWTPAFIAALAASKHVIVPSLGHVYNLAAIEIHRGDQILELQGGAALIFSGNATGDVPCILISGDFAGLRGGSMNGRNPAAPLIKTTGYRNYIEWIKATGESLDVVHVDGAETSIRISNLRGGARAGVYVNKPDLFMENVYAEQCLDGIYTNGTGSITGFHVHMYRNARHGANLIGAGYSQLVSWYADTNGSNGFNVSNTSAGFEMINCWGYKSSATEAGHSDFVFKNVQNLQLIGCRANGNADENNPQKAASFQWEGSENANNSAIGCAASQAPLGWTPGIVSTIGCRGALRRFNRPDNEWNTAGYNVSASQTAVLTTATNLETDIISPGVLSFEISVIWRTTPGANNTQSTGVERYLATVGVDGVKSSITALTSSSGMEVQNPELTQLDNGLWQISLTIRNEKTIAVQFAANIKFLSTGRGFN